MDPSSIRHKGLEKLVRTPVPFDRNVERWLQYSQSPKGRLRHDLTWYNLEHHIKVKKGKLRVLDAGCGLGDMASFLLGKAKSLVLLDFSEKMLEKAREQLSGRHPGLKKDMVKFIHGSVERLDACLQEGSFDLILCHTLLEYVANPKGIASSLVGRLVRGGILSLVAVNSFSEALRLAILKKDLIGARRALHKRHYEATLFDHVPKHTFSFEDLAELLDGLTLKVMGRYGIRIFADYLPDEGSRDSTNYRLLFELEKEASRLAPYLHVARYLHLICQKEDD
jgi:S-adenosylmethionine-dependent methyltransferase